MGNMSITCSQGSECNKVKPGNVTELLGDPNLKIEKPLTIVKFPGGDVEISRTSEGNYWVHVAVRKELDTPRHKPGKIIDARIDMAGRLQADEANAAIRSAMADGDVEHIAFLIRPETDK